ncbi:nucleotide pyrophosphohydrolase [Georgenia sp. TF02-10]|uniref:nucleotide pyrophosphohydrolase n=1 Tax=Georgenia sp. TF02-10 TaxID=2917725 RepID=UPI001FA79158|nr:nucleotide pyrophosphohydrolase [Georgenia sp. TF02-10]UNX53708.1 nucleotide pyrophosphohydrolase [Georgenia sp. TF02-10]
MDIEDVRRRLDDFTAERDWAKFHTPRNLALALVGEVGELAELLQWRTDAEVLEYARTPHGAEALADELADILTYLVELADAVGVDLGAAVHAKIDKNAAKYPVHLASGSNAKYTELRRDDGGEPGDDDG